MATFKAVPIVRGIPTGRASQSQVLRKRNTSHPLLKHVIRLTANLAHTSLLFGALRLIKLREVDSERLIKGFAWHHSDKTCPGCFRVGGTHVRRRFCPNDGEGAGC
jgi:hypothetical protein